MLPLSEKITVLNLTRKKNHAEVAENESSIHELVKEKEVFTSFAVTPQTTKLMATVHNCFIKMEKALN